MVEYNAAFFSTHESYFLILKKICGEKIALDIFRLVMEKNLKKAYDTMCFKRGIPKEFVRVVSERDKSVGLKVTLKIVDDGIIYRFHTDPFPNLRGKVSAGRLDDTYMAFKVSYLLGKSWSYKTTKHLWKGDSYTEHVISKK